MRTLYQRCPQLGCKPNFCITNYWFECPCHGSKYNALTGAVINGPAALPLAPVAVSVKDGKVVAG